MKRFFVLLTVTILTFVSLSTFALAIDENEMNNKKEKNKLETIVEIAPATISTMDGVEENEDIVPMVQLGPFFHRYDEDTNVHVNYFKLIVSSYVDNRLNDSPFLMTLDITRSEAQGSEWNFGIALTAEMKLGVLTKAGATISGGLREYKEKNEAVGSSGTMTVPAGKQGRLEAYFGGRTTGGTLWYYYDKDGVITYYNKPLGATVHYNHLDMNYKPIVF